MSVAKMEPFLLFGGVDYYASGGWADFLGSFDSPEDAAAHASQLKNSDVGGFGNEPIDWWHVISGVTGYVIRQHGTAYGQSDWIKKLPPSVVDD